MRSTVLFSILFLCCAGAAHAADPQPPPKALPVSTLAIDTDKGPVTFKIEVAGDSQSQEYGLMNRKSLAPNAGMLFDFHRTVMTSFWMKNTRIPLDMIFIRPDGIVSSVAPEAVPMSLTLIPSIEPIRSVLEIAGGRAAKLGIYPGERVHSPALDGAHSGH